VEKIFMGVQGFGVLFLFSFFFFYQVWLHQESILFGLLKVFQALLELAASRLAGRWQWLAGRQVGGGLAGQWVVV
jgi:hypothetical protein